MGQDKQEPKEGRLAKAKAIWPGSFALACKALRRPLWNCVRAHARHHMRRDLIQSHFLHPLLLWVLRTCMFLYGLGICIYKGVTDNMGGDYLVYFTNITWIMFTIYFGMISFYTAVIYGLKLSGKVEDRALNSAEESPASEPPDRKSMLTRVREWKLDLDARISIEIVIWWLFVLVAVNAGYLLVVLYSYWAAIAESDDTNVEGATVNFYTINAHGLVVAFILVEAIFNKLKIYPFHITFVIAFALAYMFFMWIWFAGADWWIYTQLSWDKASHILYYLAVVGALLGVFVVALFITWLRDYLAQLLHKRLSACKEERESQEKRAEETEDEML